MKVGYMWKWNIWVEGFGKPWSDQAQPASVVAFKKAVLNIASYVQGIFCLLPFCSSSPAHFSSCVTGAKPQSTSFSWAWSNCVPASNFLSKFMSFYSKLVGVFSFFRGSLVPFLRLMVQTHLIIRLRSWTEPFSKHWDMFKSNCGISGFVGLGLDVYSALCLLMFLALILNLGHLSAFLV